MSYFMVTRKTRTMLNFRTALSSDGLALPTVWTAL